MPTQQWSCDICDSKWLHEAGALNCESRHIGGQAFIKVQEEYGETIAKLVERIWFIVQQTGAYDKRVLEVANLVKAGR